VIAFALADDEGCEEMPVAGKLLPLDIGLGSPLIDEETLRLP
jgi:hypothetical protein